MKKLIDHQTKFVASITGGPASFSDDMLKRVHARYEISRANFDEVVRLLGETLVEFDDIFTSCDRIVDQFGCERIKTIGDGYMAVSGLPEPNPDHAQNIARAAVLFRRYIRERNRSSKVAWECRIGLATGPVIGSMIGVQKYV